MLLYVLKLAKSPTVCLATKSQLNATDSVANDDPLQLDSVENDYPTTSTRSLGLNYSH